jgi:prepilin-type N-terminal cleavage/methylation domain-containing protein
MCKLIDMKPSRFSSRRAFTLVEMLIAITVFGFASAGIMTLYLYTIQNNFISEQRLLANDDVRLFTEGVIKNARASNYILLYQSFYPYTTWNDTYPFTGNTVGAFNDANSTAATPYWYPGTTTLADPNYLTGPLDVGDEVPAGNTGDFLVFVSYTDPFFGYVNTGTTPPPPIGGANGVQVSRLILYWIAPNYVYNGAGGQPAQDAIYMYDSGIASSATTITLPWNNTLTLPATLSSTATIESLLPNYTLAQANTNYQGKTGGVQWALIALNDIRGLVGYNPTTNSGGQGFNFVNYTNKQNSSMLMRTLILNGNAAKRVTDTYNFTITPGG